MYQSVVKKGQLSFSHFLKNEKQLKEAGEGYRYISVAALT